MSVKIIQEKIESYRCQSAEEEENAMKEITQEVALLALSRAGFFKHGIFLGGTCLRILHSLNRFSEDLDFALLKPDPAFDWNPYLKEMQLEFEAYGYKLEVQDRSKADLAVKAAFLKDDSIGRILTLSHLKKNRNHKKIVIKLEIDTNPPTGGVTEMKYLNFPAAFAVQAMNLPSLFAGKTHALLCRQYVKGRDWYDFLWHAARGTPLNFELVKTAFMQNGPWKGQELVCDREWFIETMRKKIESMDWTAARADVESFVRMSERASLKLWSVEFFLASLESWAAGAPSQRR
jgi:predicted nucleotidyltransferase component of viral defense system